MLIQERLLIATATALVVTSCGQLNLGGKGVRSSFEMSLNSGSLRQISAGANTLSKAVLDVECASGERGRFSTGSFNITGLKLKDCKGKLVEFENNGTVFKYDSGFTAYLAGERGYFKDASGNALSAKVVGQLPNALHGAVSPKVEYQVTAIGSGGQLAMDIVIPSVSVAGVLGTSQEINLLAQIPTLNLAASSLEFQFGCGKAIQGADLASGECDAMKLSDIAGVIKEYDGKSVDLNYLQAMLAQSPKLSDAGSNAVFIAAGADPKLANGGVMIAPSLTLPATLAPGSSQTMSLIGAFEYRTAGGDLSYKFWTYSVVIKMPPLPPIVTTVEPDNFANGTVLNTLIPDMLFQYFSGNNVTTKNIYAHDAPFRSTGTKVFTDVNIVTTQHWCYNENFRVTFAKSPSDVSLDFVVDDTPDRNAFLRAFNAAGAMVAQSSAFVNTAGLVGQKATITVRGADISYVQASWSTVIQSGDCGGLDNLVVVHGGPIPSPMPSPSPVASPLPTPTPVQ